jgi:RNA polymerase sigma-70 factor (ECF subfamily)
VDHLAIREAGEPPELCALSYGAWDKLVKGIQNGDGGSMEELYATFYKGVRFYLLHHTGFQDLEDKLHAVFIVVVEAIRRGEIREPEKLMGFVRTVARRKVYEHIHRAVRSRRTELDLEPQSVLADSENCPEWGTLFRERMELMHRVLAESSERDREILIRFYLKEQSRVRICSEMGLTETQFRLLKSRAKARFRNSLEARMETPGKGALTRNARKAGAN